MHRKFLRSLFPSLCLVLALSLTAFGSERTVELAQLAVSGKAEESRSAIAELRAMGPAGLKILVVAYGEEINRAAAGGTLDDQQWQRLTAALDAVSQQRNSYASGLYWYTDLVQATAAAKASGKPILSLRLLGNLSEEFSCANSRFFRAVLYANKDISTYLSEKFILHWKTVRPAPRVTIDFGDGRKLERTLTGNSIHYILDSNGMAVDALPGLYGPAAFMRGLVRAETIVNEIAGKTPAARSAALRAYHSERIQAIAREWAADVAKSGGKVPVDVVARIERKSATPGAIQIAPVAVTKSGIEVDLLRSITADATALEAATDISSWNKIANLHSMDARLDEGSISFIQRQNPTLKANAALLSQTVKNLEQYLALDTVRNEYMLRTKLHGWFVTGRAGANLENLNEQVYAQLFLTPRSDPWLGLYSPDVYTALDNEGISKN